MHKCEKVISQTMCFNTSLEFSHVWIVHLLMNVFSVTHGLNAFFVSPSLQTVLFHIIPWNERFLNSTLFSLACVIFFFPPVAPRGRQYFGRSEPPPWLRSEGLLRSGLHGTPAGRYLCQQDCLAQHQDGPSASRGNADGFSSTGGKFPRLNDVFTSDVGHHV